MIATSSDDRTVRLWDPDTGKEFHVFNEPKGFACHLDWHPSGTCIGKPVVSLSILVYLRGLSRYNPYENITFCDSPPTPPIYTTF